MVFLVREVGDDPATVGGLISGMSVGGLLGGALGTALGLRTNMWIMTVGVTVSPLTLLIGPTKRDRDFPDHPADPATTTSHLPPDR